MQIFNRPAPGLSLVQGALVPDLKPLKIQPGAADTWTEKHRQTWRGSPDDRRQRNKGVQLEHGAAGQTLGAHHGKLRHDSQQRHSKPKLAARPSGTAKQSVSTKSTPLIFSMRSHFIKTDVSVTLKPEN